MGRPFIVLGDGTSHGGTVVEASQVTFTHGKPIARVGDKVTCPIPGHGTTVIVEGDPTMILDGKPVARHGDKCACGAVLISSQVVSSIGAGGGGSSAPPPSSASSSSTANAPSDASQAPASREAQEDHDFDQHFHLVDEVTGKPLAGHKYKITWPGGSATGVTDDEGLTQRVSGHHSDEVRIEVLG